MQNNRLQSALELIPGAFASVFFGFSRLNNCLFAERGNQPIDSYKPITIVSFFLVSRSRRLKLNSCRETFNDSPINSYDRFSISSFETTEKKYYRVQDLHRLLFALLLLFFNTFRCVDEKN